MSTQQTGLDLPPAVTLDDINFITGNIISIIKSANMKLDQIRLRKFVIEPPPNLLYNTITIKPSPYHGNGVFATGPIPKNSVITFYPAHAIQTYAGTNVFRSESPNTDTDFQLNINKYRVEYSACYSINNKCVAIGNPALTLNPLLLGHIINDPVGNIFKNISFTNTKNYNIFKNLIIDYYVKGLKFQNCTFCVDSNETIICVKTTTNVWPGDELLACYQPLFWFGYTYGNSDSSFFVKIRSDPDFINTMQNVNKFFCV